MRRTSNINKFIEEDKQKTDFDDMMSEVQEEIEEHDAEDVLSAVRLNSDNSVRTLTKRPTLGSMPLFNWSLPSVSTIRLKMPLEMPLTLSAVRLTPSTPTLTRFWRMPQPSCRFQSRLLMKTGRRFRKCSTKNTNG